MRLRRKLRPHLTGFIASWRWLATQGLNIFHRQIRPGRSKRITRLWFQPASVSKNRAQTNIEGFVKFCWGRRQRKPYPLLAIPRAMTEMTATKVLPR